MTQADLTDTLLTVIIVILAFQSIGRVARAIVQARRYNDLMQLLTSLATMVGEFWDWMERKE